MGKYGYQLKFGIESANDKAVTPGSSCTFVISHNRFWWSFPELGTEGKTFSSLAL